MYIIELAVEIALPTSRATLTSEHFSWLTLDRQGLTANGTDDFSLYEEQEVTFQFVPLPGLALPTVEHLRVEVDRGGGFVNTVEVHLYDWQLGEYEIFGYREGNVLEFDAPARYLGPGNAVRLRLQHAGGMSAARVRDIRIAQSGRY